MATSFPEIAAALAARGLDLAAPLAIRGRLGVVVGNTRALWPRLLAEADWSAPDPVDRYVVAAVEAAAPPGAELRYATDPHLPIQELAYDAGLAWLAPSRLCVHPVFGPWIALRALIVVDAPPPDEVEPVPPPCACAGPDGCGAAFARACAAGVPSGTAELRERWRLWLDVRDACPVGRGHRYDEAAIAYHYAGVAPVSGAAPRRPGP